jgi:hypothetical protein
VFVAVSDRDPLVEVVQALLAAEVEDLGLPAEDHRDDPGLAGQLAGVGGVIGSPVSSSAGVWLVPMRFSRVMVTTTVASTPPAWGSRSRG